MKKGLLIGKFMPVHSGHLALISFALQHCSTLTILLCHHAGEPIDDTIRENWLREIFVQQPSVNIVSYAYDPSQLTETSEPDPSYAEAWANTVRMLVPGVDVVFSSEAYGEMFAACLGAEHCLFDKERIMVPVSASEIRQKPFTDWRYLPPQVQPYFVKKVALVGSESTGKSTLAKKLAAHYRTTFVPEAARDVIGHTNECTPADLVQIATLHAQSILYKTQQANKLLFCDTELIITKSYSHFLFGKELQVPEWIEKANHCDLYLFLDTDCAFVQDGTRLSEAERESLSQSHLAELKKASVDYRVLTGNWEERFAQACHEIDQFICQYST